MRLGVIHGSGDGLRHAKSSDPVEVVVLRSTFVDPPRATAARALAARIRRVHGSAVEIVPTAWHFVTHETGDRVPVSTRRIPGAPAAFGHLRDTDEVARALETTHACAEALGASRILLRTPPSFSPGTVGRARIRAITGEQPGAWLWEPDGLWSPELAAASAPGVAVLTSGLSATGRPVKIPENGWCSISVSRLRRGIAEVIADSLEAEVVLFEGPAAYANLRVFASVAPPP